MNPNKLSVVFLNLFIISFPLSVTLSQTFAILSIFFFLWGEFSNKKLNSTLRNRTFVATFMIYFSLLPAFFWNIFQYEVSLFSVLFKSEISDFWMSLIVLPAFYHFRSLEFRSSILKSFYVSAILIVLSGFISIFTPFRLAPYITAGFKVLEGSRLQHFAGDVWGRYTYLPIGLMNTHLTFGGLCGLVFPGLSLHLILKMKEKNFWQKFFVIIFLVLFALVIFYNQSRSIWLGVIFSYLLILIKFISKTNWKYIQWKYMFIGLITLASILLLSTNIYKKNWLLQRALQESLADNTTENQRYFIYKNSFSIIKDHWFLGVGPGRFDRVHLKKSDEMIKKNEQLWYELFITPRQHAHHDVLHFLAIGGIFGLVAFLHFWYFLFRLWKEHAISSESVIFGGILVIFIAGFFQCYILDDEVTLPFFALVGLFSGSLKKNDIKNKLLLEKKIKKNQNQDDSYFVESISLRSSFSYLQKQLALQTHQVSFEKISFFASIALLGPLILSFSYICYKTRLEPDQVYKRKVTVRYPENRKLIFQSLQGKTVSYQTKQMNSEEFIRIEGCLSHKFTNPISIRNEPFLISFSFSEKTINPPTEVVIRVIERDAFDQDKLYKVHSVKRIGAEYSFTLKSDTKSYARIDDPILFKNLKNSNAFPENVFFRDFEFQFRGFDASKEYFDLPAISFGKLCDEN